MTRKWFKPPGEAITPFMFFVELKVVIERLCMAAFTSSNRLPS